MDEPDRNLGAGAALAHHRGRNRGADDLQATVVGACHARTPKALTHGSDEGAEVGTRNTSEVALMR